MSNVVKAVRSIPDSKNNQWVSNLTSGLILGFSEMIFAMSLASVIFSGRLAEYLPLGIGMAIVTVIVSMIFTATFTSNTELIGSIKGLSTVLIAVMVGSIAAGASDTTLLPTALVGILLATVSTGICFIVLGRFHLGELARYVPYPVIGGFIAGSGWLLVRSSIGTMADYPLTFGNIPNLLQSNQLILWLPGIVFGIVYFGVMRRSKHILTMPLLLIGGVVIFGIGLLLTGQSLDSAITNGLLVGQGDSVIRWQVPQLRQLPLVDWNILVSQIGNFATIAMITSINLLLTISSLEIALKADVDLAHELQTAGFASILSGLMGGIIGFHSMSLSLLNNRIGTTGRSPALIAACFCIVMLILGTGLLAYIPLAILGGLVFYIGADFLYDWLVVGREKLSRVDYVTVLLIVLTIAFTGFLTGVLVGIILMILSFVVNYSRTDIVQYIRNGNEVSSNVERSVHHLNELQKIGQHIQIIELRGFIFFGTANKLLGKINARSKDNNKKQLLFLIIDFRRVTGLDSSAVMVFQKMLYYAEAREFQLLFSYLSDDVQAQFMQVGFFDSEQVNLYPDLDHALEWCEDTLLDDFGVTTSHIASFLMPQLEDMGFDKKYYKPLMTYLEKRPIKTNDYIMKQSDPADEMYFLEVGDASVYIEAEGAEKVRVRTLKMGTIVGEVGFYLNEKRSASVIANTNGIVQALTREKFELMKKENAELALEVSEMLTRVVAERLVRSNRTMVALTR